MSFRYIGSKARLVGTIEKFIEKPNNNGCFVDAFCGTGAVAEAAAMKGWPIWVNDSLVSASVIASARLICIDDVPFEKLGGYAAAIKSLNVVSPIKGFIWKEYSPASINFIEVERRYFTEKNASRIDAIRSKIYEWKRDGCLTKIEEVLLIADLLGSINKVANTAGTYGCFLSKWTKPSLADLTLITRELKLDKTDVLVTTKNVNSLSVHRDDLVYLDPPYTKRQYASYYHILETVVHGDEPIVEGVSGLRPWRDKASDFCYKTRATNALSELIKNLDAKKILLSYSEEGHIPIDELHENLRKMGKVTTNLLMDVGRYRPNKIASAKRSSVKEYLIVIDKEFQNTQEELCIEFT